MTWKHFTSYRKTVVLRWYIILLNLKLIRIWIDFGEKNFRIVNRHDFWNQCADAFLYKSGFGSYTRKRKRNANCANPFHCKFDFEEKIKEAPTTEIPPKERTGQILLICTNSPHSQPLTTQFPHHLRGIHPSDTYTSFPWNSPGKR